MKSPKLLIHSADSITETPLPHETPVPLKMPVLVRDSRSGVSFVDGIAVAREAGAFRFNVSAEASIARELILTLFHVEKNAVYKARAHAPLNDDGQPDHRVQVGITKIIELAEGDHVQAIIQQNGSPNSLLWPHPDSVYIEIENIGY